MSAEEDKQAIRQIFAECDKVQTMAPFSAFVPEDYVAHFPGIPELDREGMKALGASFYGAFPGLTHSIKEMVADGDFVAARLVISGTHTADFATPDGVIPATNRPLNLNSLNLFRIRSGRPVEHWIEFDMMGFMKQLGVA